MYTERPGGVKPQKAQKREMPKRVQTIEAIGGRLREMRLQRIQLRIVPIRLQRTL